MSTEGQKAAVTDAIATLALSVKTGDARRAGRIVDALRFRARLNRREILERLGPLGVTEGDFEGAMIEADELESES